MGTDSKDLIVKRLSLLPGQKSIYKPLLHLSRLEGYVAAVVSTVVAFLLRTLIDPILPAGFPFLTFFPAVMAVAFLYGAPAGLLCAVGSTFGAIQFIPIDGWQGLVLPLGFFWLIVAFDIVIVHLMNMALFLMREARDEAVALAEQRSIFVDELTHRIKNLLANVNALMSMAARHSCTVPELLDAVRSRVRALGDVSSILQSDIRDSRIALRDVIVTSVTPVIDLEGVRIHGDAALRVTYASATSLSLIFHELATNTAKYGQLPGGRIEITLGRSGDTFKITWWETTTTPEQPETLRKDGGFGTVLITRLVTVLGGSFTRTFGTGDMTVAIEIPYDNLAL